jgi:hypothetical protein
MHLGRFVGSFEREIDVFAKDATPGSTDSAKHEHKVFTTRAKGKLLRWVEQRTLG